MTRKRDAEEQARLAAMTPEQQLVRIGNCVLEAADLLPFTDPALLLTPAESDEVVDMAFRTQPLGDESRDESRVAAILGAAQARTKAAEAKPRGKAKRAAKRPQVKP